MPNPSGLALGMFPRFARVAQLVERMSYTHLVPGSSPGACTKLLPSEPSDKCIPMRLSEASAGRKLLASLFQMHLFVGSVGTESEVGMIPQIRVFCDEPCRLGTRGLDELEIL